MNIYFIRLRGLNEITSGKFLAHLRCLISVDHQYFVFLFGCQQLLTEFDLNIGLVGE